MTKLQKERIIFLRAQGKSYARIADALGISINTIQSYCRRNNLAGCINDNLHLAADDSCVNCRGLLIHTPGSKRKRFCSDKCRLRWWAAHPEALNRKAIYRFVCPVCGTEFDAYGNAHRIYCSRACLGRFPYEQERSTPPLQNGYGGVQGLACRWSDYRFRSESDRYNARSKIRFIFAQYIPRK